MEKQRVKDQIDIELSKTYFGTAVFPHTLKKEHEHTQEKPEKPGKQTSGKNLKTVFICFAAAAVVLGLSAALFLKYNRIVFTFNVKPADTAAISVSEDNDTGAKKSLRIIPSVSAPRYKEETTLPERNLENGITVYDFERDNDGWEIPAWAFDKEDHVARTLERTEAVSSSGNGSIGLYVEFPGAKWAAALAEIEHYLDITPYGKISVDIYLPKDAPEIGLRGKLILTVDNDWKFVEMTRGTRLKPGQWTIVTADLTENSTDWSNDCKTLKINDQFKSDVRKISVRLESTKTPYSGPVYIDNLMLYASEKVKAPGAAPADDNQEALKVTETTTNGNI
ncbi:MAG: hypothetical protein ABH883_01345 [Candidatus Omnitrophota bacterium]